MNTYGKKIVIIGGVAGGASCATRARRLSENARIIMFERGPYVSFANCGLPYYVGDVITDENNLIVAEPELFRNRFNIDVRLNSDVISIDRANKCLEVKETHTGKTYLESYDALVLAPGSKPIRPPLPGIDLPGIFTLRTIPESRSIRDWIDKTNARKAVIVGGGFIGLEMAENLVKRGLTVRIVEMASHVMPAIDSEMAIPVGKYLEEQGLTISLGDGVAGFEKDTDGYSIKVYTTSGAEYLSDLVILSIGVRPEIQLAEDAGLQIGSLGGIRADSRLQTSDKNIWAVGDAVEVKDFITGNWTLLPLAGPANRQGRIAAGVILGRDYEFRGVQNTVACKVFERTIAATGLTEKSILRYNKNGRSINYEKIYLEPGQHVSYYPDASPISIKLIFENNTGKVLGAQAVGREGVEKRIDVLAMAIQMGATVFDLEEAELCYAPQFGAAKDPVNLAGMIAANALRGDAPVVHWDQIDNKSSFLLDVRDTDEFSSNAVEGAVNIPLNSLRSNLDKLPDDKEIFAYCAVGQRSYYASRLLRERGYNARGLSGGFNILNASKKSGQS